MQSEGIISVLGTQGVKKIEKSGAGAISYDIYQSADPFYFFASLALNGTCCSFENRHHGPKAPVLLKLD
jgi:hypothetical protein